MRWSFWFSRPNHYLTNICYNFANSHPKPLGTNGSAVLQLWAKKTNHFTLRWSSLSNRQTCYGLCLHGPLNDSNLIWLLWIFKGELAEGISISPLIIYERVSIILHLRKMLAITLIVIGCWKIVGDSRSLILQIQWTRRIQLEGFDAWSALSTVTKSSGQ